jgi:hypothetical protein
MTNLDTDSAAGGEPSASQDPLHVVFMVDDQAIVGESIRRMLAEDSERRVPLLPRPSRRRR